MDENTTDNPANEPAVEAAGADSPTRRRVPVVAAAAAALVVAALAGAGIALAVNDNDDDDLDPVNVTATDGASGSTGATESDSASTVDVDVADFWQTIETASAAAEGVPVSIETNGRAWLVEFEQANGTETTVRVENGEAKAVETDRDDDRGQIEGLTRDNLESAIAAALAEVDGTPLAVSIDDDSIDDAFSVEVLRAGSRQVVEVDLDRDFRVTDTETDD